MYVSVFVLNVLCGYTKRDRKLQAELDMVTLVSAASWRWLPGCSGLVISPHGMDVTQALEMFPWSRRGL